MKTIFLNMILCMSIFVGLVFVSVPARADLAITPTRLVFEGRDRFKDVTLVNTGDEPQSYEMSWAFFRMQEEGVPYAPATETITEFDASKYIFFSPRRVTLAPGANQKIRLALRRPEVVPPGDYHIHLKFATVAEPDDPDGVKSGKPKAVVSINVGYTIPVVFRAGEPDVQASIERIGIVRNPVNGMLKAKVPVRREGGPYSILGHLFVYHIDSKGKETKVGEISNAHIFPEVNKRLFEVQLNKEISGGSLRVVMKNYTLDESLNYAEATFPLN